MYLYNAVLSDNVGISIKNENLLTGLRLLTPTVYMIKLCDNCVIRNKITLQQLAS